MKDDFENLIPEELALYEPRQELLDVINSKDFDDNILYSVESAFHRVSVVENEIGRFLHFKDTYQAGFIDTAFYKGNLPYINYFLIPALMKPDIKNILLIGMGTGKIVKDFENIFENLESIDVVDIEENILNIAKDYFGFVASDKFSFELQDGRIFLRETNNKYDLIVVDVAGDDGIDKRFLEDSYFEEVKKCLTPNGIFVSNLCASAHFEDKRNIIHLLLEKYKKHFSNIDVYKGNYSDKVYYKAFFDLDERVIDITNVILISSNCEFKMNDNIVLSQSKKIKKLGVDIKPYLADCVKGLL